MKADLQDKASYIHEFTTTGDRQTIEVPLKEMKSVYRGRKLDISNFSADTIQEIRFLIANKKEEKFRLEIDKIELVH